jgi:polyhydroxyalkanoate synthase
MAVPPRSRVARAAQAGEDAPRTGSGSGAAVEVKVAPKRRVSTLKEPPRVVPEPKQAAPAKAVKPAKKPPVSKLVAEPEPIAQVEPDPVVAAPSSAPEPTPTPSATPLPLPFAAMGEALTKPFQPFASFGKGLPGGLEGMGGAALGLDALKLPGLPQVPGLLGGVLDPLKQAALAMGDSLGSAVQSLAGLTLSTDEFKQIQQDYMEQASSLWNLALDKPGELKPKDRRFAAPEWASNPASAFMASLYLLNAQTMRRLADSLQGDVKARERVRFSVQQWVDAVSPSNFLALNPEALKKAVETKGSSLTQGVQHLLSDLRQGHLSQTDESVFHVGQNVATTAGTVVFENAFFQLIEYTPLTPNVHETPFLFVPPCINKFYILDLQPDNSLVRYALAQGHRVFMVSWVNADESLAQSSWDDYVSEGVIEAINVTRDITGAEQINALGFCVGGTLLATALATLAARGEKPVASLTLLTTFLDFGNTGIMDIFVDEVMVRTREMTLGPNSPKGGGLMKGTELAATFSFLRANDLVWNYVVGNYLKGEMPPAFDLLYWNSDSTNLPGPMYTWYLRNTYLENKLATPGAVSVCGEPLDLSLLDMPVFIYGSREDHIVPWDSAYASTQLLSGPTTFVLGASGHIAGVINPPEKKKRSFWIAEGDEGALPEFATQWMEAAQEQPGSWWPVWADWLAGHAGEQVPSPKAPGNRRHTPIEAAPGRYVLRKA